MLLPDTNNMETNTPEDSTQVDLSEFEEKFETLGQMLFSKINSHFICHKTSRIVINTIEGFAIVHNNKVKTYYEDGPFMSKCGVKISSLLSNRDLIALVPDRDVTINSETHGRLGLEMSSVYVFDININSIIYQKNFNHPVRYLHFTNSYIFAGDNKRIIAVKYSQDIKAHENLSLEELIIQYQARHTTSGLRFLETGCKCEVLDPNCVCGKIKASDEQPQIVAYVKHNRQTVGIFITQLDYYYDYVSWKYDDICLSSNGELLAIVSEGGLNTRIISLRDKQVFTELRRGYSPKPTLCLGFIDDWFGMASQSRQYATFHLFQVKKRNQNEMVPSKFKRYFSTYSSSVDFLKQDDKLVVISLIGGYLQIMDMKKAKDSYGEDVKSLKPEEIQMWS